MKRITALLMVLAVALSFSLTPGYADFEMSQNEMPPDIEGMEAEANEASIPDYLKAEKRETESPLGFAVRYCNDSGSKENIVKMLPGQSGELTDSARKQYLRWAMDEEGYFVISFEKCGDYSFRFTDIGQDNGNATFGATVIGAGGGGGGAHTEPKHAVGSGGSGGEVIQKSWTEFGSGLKIASYTSNTTVRVGKGGTPGKSFTICLCGGNKCPLGGKSGLPDTNSDNSGGAGGPTTFGNITAAGGAAGKGSFTPGGRDSGIKSIPGNDGRNCGTFIFWGVEYNCGFAGAGGSFGVNDGPGGDPVYFHDPNTVSFGRSGTTIAGKGNGGGGSGMSYSFGHPQISGTGTGEGMGSYSHTIEGTPAKGGDSSCYNGYVYLEGRVHTTEETKPVIERYQLIATVKPTIINPIPVVSWESTKCNTAKVSPMGTVSVYDNGEATITATAKAFGVQGVYQVNNGSDGVRVTADRTPVKVGDTAILSVTSSVPDNYVYWNTTNQAVASVNPNTGEVKINKTGIAVITATLSDGKQGSYTIHIQ